jgi:tetratricopeptide (TPR) repeat protein
MKLRSLVIAVVAAVSQLSCVTTGTPESYYNRGKEYFNNGNYDRALKYYNRALELNPDYADTLNSLGDLYYAIADYDKAY